MPPLYQQPLGDLYWLGVHEGHHGRPLLASRPRGYGLAAALVAELVLVRCAHIAGDSGQHGAGAPLVFLIRGAPPPADPALAEVYADLGVPAGQHHVADAAGRPGRHAHRDDRPGRPEHPAPPSSPLERGPDWHTGQDLGAFLAFWAPDTAAERLVRDRLRRSGLARVEVRHKLFKGSREVVVPRDSTVSGSPLSSISATLRGSGRPSVSYPPGAEPWRLPPPLLLLAALFDATLLYEVPAARLDERQRHHLDEQLPGIDPQLRILFASVASVLSPSPPAGATP